MTPSAALCFYEEIVLGCRPGDAACFDVFHCLPTARIVVTFYVNKIGSAASVVELSYFDGALSAFLSFREEVPTPPFPGFVRTKIKGGSATVAMRTSGWVVSGACFMPCGGDSPEVVLVFVGRPFYRGVVY